MNQTLFTASPELTQALQASAAERRQIVAAARLLAEVPSLSEIEWDDLLTVPTWALDRTDDALALDTLCVGAWAHLDAIRRCIDGRLMAHLAGLLGQQEVGLMLSSERLRDEAGAPLATLPDILSGRDVAGLRQHLMFVGQWCLLLEVGRYRVRRALAQALWPHVPHLQNEQPPAGLSHALSLAILRARQAQASFQAMAA